MEYRYIFILIISRALFGTNQSDLLEKYQPNISSDPNDFAAHFLLARELFQQKDLEGAINHYQRAIELGPTISIAHFDYGIALQTQGNHEQAFVEFLETLKYNPDHAQALIKAMEYLQYEEQCAPNYKIIKIHKLGQTIAEHHQVQGAPDSSFIHYRKALLCDPKYERPLLDCAYNLSISNNLAAAYEIYQAIYGTGIKIHPLSYNLAHILFRMGRIDEAIAKCKEVIALSPEHAPAHFCLGSAYLTLGNYKDGWKEYEWRWKQEYIDRTFSQPVWDGSDLTGKTIFLHAEQGLGDTFQFIRYAKTAKDMGAHVIASVQDPLVNILSSCPYIDELMQYEAIPKHFDTHAALLTLPLILNTQEETIPAMNPYLFADETLVALWKEKLKDDKNFKIGICWQGNPNYNTHFLRLVVASKSIRPSTFAPIGTIPGITLYSLQKDHANNVDESLPEGFIVHTFDGNFDKDHGRFMDTAAVMKNLNLIITVDTSIAHLAGGLGVPVWVMLPKPADWRWLLDRTDSPWYPTMRLFRQTVTGNWTTVIDEICETLRPIVHNQIEQLYGK